MSAFAAIAILFLIVFLGGTAIGVLLIVSWASNREDKKKSLKGPAPGNGCGGARRLAGVGRRDGTPDGSAEYRDPQLRPGRGRNS